MKKVCSKIRKQFACVVVFVFLQMTVLTSSMSIPHDAGGGNDGDPAPGRSPGPPSTR